MAEVVDLDRLIVSAGVPSAEVRSLAVGQSTDIVVEGFDRNLSSELTFISPQLDSRTDTVVVRAAMPVGTTLRPGQRVTLRIVSDEHANRLAVPIDSVVRDEDGASVIAIVEGDHARQVPVTTGLRDQDLIEINGPGLRSGMTVVTAGAYGLPAETRIRVIEN
jgi:RND family efflux transporter MFP subunit